MSTGRFIVLDGNDGSGKATQTALLAERLAVDGIACKKIDFPGYQDRFFGKFVGECLAGQHGDFVHMDPKVASIPYALDRLEASGTIRAWIAEGAVVVADRFSSSNQIHQGGKIADPAERAAFLAWLDQMEHEVLGVPRPDAVIYLDVPIETSLELLSKKRAAKNHTLGDEDQDTVEKDRDYLVRSHESARALAETQAGWHIVSCTRDGAMRSPEDIHEEVHALVQKLRA